MARLRDPAAMAAAAPNRSADWRDLGVSLLHELVINRFLHDETAHEPAIRYVHLLREAADAVAAKSCDVAALIPPTTMGHVERIAGRLEKMPPKSTYFYPKLLTGLVFNSLKKD